MTQIYDQFDSATRGISAVALIRDGRSVGRVVLKFGNAATAYVQLWGATMTRGRATGYGYDKASAAVGDAARRLLALLLSGEDGGQIDPATISAFAEAFDQGREGRSWQSALEHAGFTLAIVIG